MLTRNFFNRITPFLLFSPDDGGGGGGSESKDEEKKPDLTDEEKKVAADKEKQDKLNKEFADRASRAAEAERKKILDELGVKDVDEAKTRVEAARKADDAQKSELEKADAARQKAEAEAVQAKADAEKIRSDAFKRVLDGEIKFAAGTPVKDKEGKVVRTAFRKEALDDVLLLVNRDVIEDKDGKFEGIEKALGELAKAKPWLLSEEDRTKFPKGNPKGPGRKQSGGDGENDRQPIIGSL